MKKSYILLLVVLAIVVTYRHREGMCPTPAAEIDAANKAACDENKGIWNEASKTCTCPA
jgi:hypothetical protein